MLTQKAMKAVAQGNSKDAEQTLESIEPRWTGIVAHRALVPSAKLKAYRDAHPDQDIRVPEENSIPRMVRCDASTRYPVLGNDMYSLVVYGPERGKSVGLTIKHVPAN